MADSPNQCGVHMSMFNLAEMRARHAKLRAELDNLEPLLELAERYERTFGSDPRSETEANGMNRTGVIAAAAPVRREGSVMQKTIQAARDLLERTGAPITTVQVINVLGDYGLVVPDKNPVNVISARLSNSGEFVGRRGHGWWFRDRPWPGEEPSLALNSSEEHDLS